MVEEYLTPAEAALVAAVSLRNVNRVFDERLLPDRFVRLDGGRWLSVRGCGLVSFFFHTASRLTAKERTRIIREVTDERNGEWPHGGTVADEIMTVNINGFIEDATARHETLCRAREAVVEHPEILDGAPVLEGTRIPVHDLAASLRDGQSPARIKAAYPGLTDAMIGLAKVYADANPARGRPRNLNEIHAGLELVSARKVARRREG